MGVRSCRGHGCTSTDLVEAHIFPRGFARDMMAGFTHNMKLSLNNVGTTQHGVYDRDILCARCDNILGELDDFALDVCRRFPKEVIVHPDDTFEMKNVDGDTVAKFVLSLLWRASITARFEFRKTSLGTYESTACEVIFGAQPLSSIRAYQLIIGRFRSTAINPERFYTAPVRFKWDDLNGWAFALHGFRFMAKIDRRPWPRELNPAIVNGNDKLLGVFVNYETTGEHRAALSMVGGSSCGEPVG
jgi:hypothetical protein